MIMLVENAGTGRAGTGHVADACAGAAASCMYWETKNGEVKTVGRQIDACCCACQCVNGQVTK